MLGEILREPAFPADEFEVTVPSPGDSTIGVGFDGRWVEVDELPWFDIEWSPVVARSAGSLRVTFQAFPDAAVAVDVTSQCGAARPFAHYGEPGGTAGRVDVPLTDPAYAGDCAHELRLTQTIARTSHGLDALIQVGRTEILTFSSTN